MLKKKLLVIGAHNPETLRIIEDMNKSKKDNIDFLGWIDDDNRKIGTEYFGYKVHGPIDELSLKKFSGVYVFNNVTSNVRTREIVTEKIKNFNSNFISLIHPTINIKYVKIGKNVCIQEGTILQSGSIIDDNAFICANSLIAHDVHINNNTFISSKVAIGGKSKIEKNVTLWMGCTIGPELTIGENSIIGMNATILNNVEKNSTLITKPAILIKKD